MALGLSTSTEGGGDYAQIVKYDARAGRAFRVDRSQDAAGAWQTDNVDITTGFQFIPDLDSVQVGWALFTAGSAPSWTMVPLGVAMPPKPTPDHKQCFKLMLKLGKSSGGDVRELASQAKVVIGAMDALHTTYEAEKASHPGQLPVVVMKSTTPIKSGSGAQTSTNYAPVFEITKWVDRPAELSAAPPRQQEATSHVASTAKAAAHVSAPAADDEDEF